MKGSQGYMLYHIAFKVVEWKKKYINSGIENLNFTFVIMGYVLTLKGAIVLSHKEYTIIEEPV